MLERILEPEVMDTCEEARDYDDMDHREVNERFVNDLLAAWPEALADPFDSEDEDFDTPLHFPTALDMGTGTAQIPVLLCKRCENVRVVAIDAAASMLDLANLHVEIAGLNDQIHLVQADAKATRADAGRFDCVMSNSIIHHLPNPIEGLREAIRIVKPGGLLFFRDLVRPSSKAELWRLVDLYAPPADAADDASQHQRSMFAASLHAALTLDEIRSLITDLGFPPESVTLSSDRHWTWSARKP